MTETLLWLSRKSYEVIPDDHVELDKLVLEISEDFNYLLQGKSIEPHLRQTRFFLSDLVRNAFQNFVSLSIQITHNFTNNKAWRNTHRLSHQPIHPS